MTTQLEQLAAFVNRSSFGQLSENALEQLKIRVLDAAIGCSICALGAPTIRLVRDQTDGFGGTGYCSLIGGAEWLR